MRIESHGVATGDVDRPFVARITIGTKKQRDVLAEFQAPSLAVAQREAEDWMAEYCARLGLGDPGLRTPETMRSRWGRLRNGMPDLPEPGAAYCSALEAAAPDTDDGEVVGSASQVSRTRRSYASRSKIVSAVAAARAAEIDVAGIRVWPDGSIAVFDPRGISDQRPVHDSRSTDDDL